MQKHKHTYLSVHYLLLLTGFLPSYSLGAVQELAEAENSKPGVSGPITRAEILTIARRYAEHKWSVNSDHVFHGLDMNGNQVDTPDKDYRAGGFEVGEENVGIPYKWGGFSSIDQFDQGISENMFAGHLPKKGSSPASSQAVGVDCSGLVSRCWDLPKKHSTRSLGNLCYDLDSYDELKPGDIINRFDGHAVIFESFADAERTKVVVYEAGGTKVQKSVYPVSQLKKGNFKPLRYKPLDDRWKPQSLAPPSMKMSDIDQVRFEPDGENSPPFGEITNPLMSAKQGDWAIYELGPSDQVRLSVSSANSEDIVIRSRYSRAGKSQWNERSLGTKDSILKAIIDFGGFDQDFGKLKLNSEKVVSGRFRLSERSFEAYHLFLEIDTSLLLRGTTYPATIKVDCLISNDVPMLGIIKCKYVVTFMNEGKPIGGSVKKMKLIEFFKG